MLYNFETGQNVKFHLNFFLPPTTTQHSLIGIKLQPIIFTYDIVCN